MLHVANVHVRCRELNSALPLRFDVRSVEVDVHSRELAKKGLTFGLCGQRRCVELHENHGLPLGSCLPNESRLSCGRNAQQRKAAERKRRFASEATQFFSTYERPAASSAC